MCGQHLVSYILQCVLPWGLTEAPSDLSCSSRGQLRIRKLPGAGALSDSEAQTHAGDEAQLKQGSDQGAPPQYTINHGPLHSTAST